MRKEKWLRGRQPDQQLCAPAAESPPHPCIGSRRWSADAVITSCKPSVQKRTCPFGVVIGVGIGVRRWSRELCYFFSLDLKCYLQRVVHTSRERCDGSYFYLLNVGPANLPSKVKKTSFR
ncbi:uncharacterized protein PHACADRAFT_253255 [Phanerochaete carnosa HHB-10118-sp]|uniref:Uncharacterized protein n=1 Tax=Phanerochaete carnosa (strain HHB-10118-sp) TaxID=650164 RepID=K5VXD6_PHACS|nr:uncharacterized protein PHACADRAFT_253255 [Phanerochaete carnosa HHB-10118-sp]EKM56238.1 hypothetical protein PHACADRAFT_253255 [Phanerochaete carnosa HHB-10118-sp]